MRVKLWGVRGSIPSPGPSTVRYGGNTSCVSIEQASDHKILILDAGTGIRELGKVLAEGDEDIYVLSTHYHWDHIQGFPFFLPLYQPNQQIYSFPSPQGKKLCESIEQMDGAHFPITPDALPSQYECVIADETTAFLHDHGFQVSHLDVNHPGGSSGYRIENDGQSVVYIPDNELAPPGAPVTDFDGFVQFCRHADVLIHDAQYLEADMPHKRGWGHSLVSQVCELAAAAEVKHLILYHHDPDRTDDELDVIQADARAWFRKHNYGIGCTAGYEGLVLEL